MKSREIPLGVIFFVVILLMMLCCYFVYNFYVVEKEFVETGEIYKVKPGDTLYEISSRQIDEEVDIRRYIYELKKHNNIEDSNIKVGQEIELLEVE